MVKLHENIIIIISHLVPMQRKIIMCILVILFKSKNISCTWTNILNCYIYLKNVTICTSNGMRSATRNKVINKMYSNMIKVKVNKVQLVCFWDGYL